MSGVRVSRGSVAGFETVVLESGQVRAVIVPSLGGRVWELEDRVRGRQWIWQRADVPLAASAPGDAYDDVWAGGWEELFPNDAPGRFEGRTLPDHGEWWTMAWDVVEASGDVVRLSAQSSVVQALCSKDFRLASDQARLTVSYRIRSLERRPFHFLFKQHLPVKLTPACRLILPGGRVRAVDPSFGSLLPGPGPFEWPLAKSSTGAITDLRVVPSRSRELREFVYVTHLPQSWCGIEDREQNASLCLTFDARTLPFVWLFLSYGGWRDTYTAVLEPCTNMPKDLQEAVRLGQSACLHPREEFATTVSVALADRLEPDR